ncbi:HPP family protein [Massilia sp. TS11]|uniref:HPP family protein n=1 Tax=Massilia sp. TS11 TaxID=2908003 RepID=UPI001EDB58F2|nr:HPP family protein [Massilia sp. TS11]MCG2586726.1 HPP family protein [Massilia sp. TS11]
MRHFLPPPPAVPLPERLRAVLGALLGLGFAALLSFLTYGAAPAALYLAAPIGASAVIVFCLPASPLAQPWPVLAGNVVSALVGVAVWQLLPQPLLAAPLAGALAIAAMFALRCLHPPGGSVALTAVLGGAAVHQAGFGFALWPVGLNSALLVLAALLYNNLSGRRYPHLQQLAQTQTHGTGDRAPTARLGFSAQDLEGVLQRYGQVLDVSLDDLEAIILQTEAAAYQRRFGVIYCEDVMSLDVVSLEFATPLQQAWDLMRRHHLHALPVLNRARRVIGILTLSDFLQHAQVDQVASLGARLRAFLRPRAARHSEQPEVVGQIMHTQVKTVRADAPIASLVPLMANAGLHHLPVVDAEQRFVGMLTQSDVLAALYETRLAELAAR